MRLQKKKKSLMSQPLQPFKKHWPEMDQCFFVSLAGSKPKGAVGQGSKTFAMFLHQLKCRFYVLTERDHT